MFIKIPTLINFNIENTYKEFAKIFDNKESNIRYFKLNFKPFLGFRRAYPDKVIFIHQAPEGNIRKFVQSNSE